MFLMSNTRVQASHTEQDYQTIDNDSNPLWIHHREEAKDIKEDDLAMFI